MKRNFTATIAFALALFCFTAVAHAAQKPKVFKYAASQTKGVPVVDSAYVFADEVEKRSNGAMKIRVYEHGKLGGSVASIEAVQRGNVEFVGTTISNFASFTKAFMPLSLPYLFTDKAHAYRFLDSDVGEQIMSAIEKKQNLLILGWLENGNRHIFNSTRPIYKPEDVSGMKIRVMENPIQMQTISSMGGLPTPMAMNEQFTALQQGQIDGAENSYQNIRSNKLFEVAKYLSETRHFYEVSTITINADLFYSLSEEEQKILKEAAQIARDDCRRRTATIDDEIREELKDKIAINSLTQEQIDEFRKITQPVHQWLKDQNYDPLNAVIMDAVERLR